MCFISTPRTFFYLAKKKKKNCVKNSRATWADVKNLKIVHVILIFRSISREFSALDATCNDIKKKKKKIKKKQSRSTERAKHDEIKQKTCDKVVVRFVPQAMSPDEQKTFAFILKNK